MIFQVFLDYFFLISKKLPFQQSSDITPPKNIYTTRNLTDGFTIEWTDVHVNYSNVEEQFYHIVVTDEKQPGKLKKIGVCFIL